MLRIKRLWIAAIMVAIAFPASVTAGTPQIEIRPAFIVSYSDFDGDGYFEGWGTPNQYGHLVGADTRLSQGMVHVWRTAMEFDLSQQSIDAERVNSAKLVIQTDESRNLMVTNPDGSFAAPIWRVNGYAGDGQLQRADVVSGSPAAVNVVVPARSFVEIDVSAYVRSLIASGNRYAGFGLQVEADYRPDTFQDTMFAGRDNPEYNLTGPKLVLSLAPASRAIDTTPSDTTACCYGEANANAYFAQSFVALGPRIESFTFYVMQNRSDLNPGPYTFRVLLVSGAPNTPGPRTVLFESSTYAIEASSRSVPVTVDLSGVRLVTGQTYTWILDSYAPRDGINDVGQIAWRSSNQYAGGNVFSRNATDRGREADLNEAWNPNYAYDAAFLMTFAGPVANFRLNTNVIAGCKSVTGSAVLTWAAPRGGTTAVLADSLRSTSLPSTLYFPEGTTVRTFRINTAPVASAEVGQVELLLDGETFAEPLTVRPMGLGGLLISPNPVVGGIASTGTATLECAAGPGAVLVTLGSTNSTVATPVAASVFVPQGLRAATFDITTSRVLSTSKAVISASANGISKAKQITLTPAAVVSPTALRFGSVSLNTSRTASTRLSNKGAIAFAVREIALGGPSPQHYRITHNCPATLDPGSFCDITVTFTPSVATYRSAYLYVATDATSVPLKVLVSGTGTVQ